METLKTNKHTGTPITRDLEYLTKSDFKTILKNQHNVPKTGNLPKYIDAVYEGEVELFKKTCPKARTRYVPNIMRVELFQQAIKSTFNWLNAIKNKDIDRLNNILISLDRYRKYSYQCIFQQKTKIILSDIDKARRLQIKAWCIDKKLQKEKAEQLVEQLQTAKQLKNEAKRQLLFYLHGQKVNKEQYQQLIKQQKQQDKFMKKLKANAINKTA